ncbi:cobyric acid synthase [Xanthobacter sp. TB0136]|uniref:cobyric acid synthase n=1 Tax=Xanthobacter sp. TB0136 TaxID=3459177 RepID=UPI00403A4295
MARALMVQGTGSNVGKSLLVAGLCRVFMRQGLRVRPFKPQNMSNNAAVTADGGEIGRAQALQARAAGVAPSVHMNPVLLKPQSDIGAQIVVQGRVFGTARAREYQGLKPRLMAAVQESFAHLGAEADLVLVEGAGSAAEVNLRAADIANMGFARATGTPVILVGDIDRGGVIAALVGTKAVIDPQDARMIRGFIVNRFRGDPALFSAGMDIIAERTGWTALGLVPHFDEARRLPAEDALGLASSPRRPGKPLIVVPVTPRLSNFDDLDPLREEEGVEVRFISPGTPLPADAALILLAGSKATIDDLLFVKSEGWDIDIKAHLRRGGRVMGLCGGYQMLGRFIDDSAGLEGPPRRVEGLGLLDVETRMETTKRLALARGLLVQNDVPVEGYEMHMGVTTGPDTARPFALLEGGRTDGARSAGGQVSGTYLHGLFAGAALRRHVLAQLGAQASAFSHEAMVDAVLDRFADHLEAHLDCAALLHLADAGKGM